VSAEILASLASPTLEEIMRKEDPLTDRPLVTTREDLQKLPSIGVVCVIQDDSQKEYLFVGFKRRVNNITLPEELDGLPLVVRTVRDVYVRGHTEVTVR